jgi:hypothetical protein
MGAGRKGRLRQEISLDKNVGLISMPRVGKKSGARERENGRKEREKKKGKREGKIISLTPSHQLHTTQ